MITVNNAIKNLLKAKHRQVVRITVGTTGLTLTGEDIAQDGLSIDRYCVSGSSLELGSAIASELTLKLLNFDGKFNNVTLEGQELRVEQGFIDGNNHYWFDMGYFIVDTPPRTKSTISITALDRMVNFDDSAYAWSATQTYPKTVAQYVSAVCARCQVPLATDLSTLPNYNVSIPKDPIDNTETTFRNIIQWAAAVMGTCAYINELGQMVFGWFADTDINITPEYRYQGADLWEGTTNITGYIYSRSVEQEVQKSEVIDGEVVTYTDTEVKDETYVAGSEVYAFDLTGNPFIYYTPQQILNNLYSTVGTVSYKPFECTTIPFPYIMPLDRITYTDPQENEITTIVTNVVHNLNLGSTIAAKGETDTSRGYSTGTGFTPTQNKELTREQFLLEQASAAASSAKASATSAHNAAVSANISANGALTSLSVVEDVAGTLNWIREHGSFVQTTDVIVKETTVYFELIDGEYVPIVLPDPSKNPMEEGWYVLDVSDSQSEYIMAHLAVTSAGLWVLPYNQLAPHPLIDSEDNDLVDSDDNQLVDWSKDPRNASGYKVLLSNTGMTVYDDEGAPIANYGETTTIGHPIGHNVHITNNAVLVRDGSTVLASYGDTIIFYEPDGETEAVEIGSDGMVIKEGIIKLGNKTSASDVTNSGTYIDSNGNMATSDIKAHGGTIGGFSINETQLNAYSSNGLYRVVANSNPGTNGGDVAFGVASRASTSAGWTWNAYMTHAGFFRATNANISGIISSSSGTIGGWGIYPTGLYYPDNSSSAIAKVTSSVVKVGDSSLGYVMIGAVGNTAGTWGIQSSDDYNFSIENGITNIVFGKDSAVVRPVVGGDVSLGANGHRFLDVWCTRGAFNGSDLKEKSVIDDFDWKVDEFIQGLQPIAFKRTWEDGSKSERIELGFGAQDVAKLSKDLGIGDLHLYNATIIDKDENGEKIEKPYHGEDIDDSKLSWSLAYTELIAPMVLEIQRLMKRVDELEAKIKEMEG